MADLALVIGGGNGIGAACCEVFKARGWSVAIGDKDIAAAQILAQRLDGKAYALDVSNTSAIEALCEQVGPLDVLVVSSGIFQANQPIEDTDPALFDALMQVNVRGTWQANRVFGMAMAKRGKGAIVNLASVTGHGSTPNNIYGPGKAAIINMTKNFAGETLLTRTPRPPNSPAKFLVMLMIAALPGP